MNARAMGWDIHRKFSMVSVREITDAGELRVIERRRLDHADQDGMRKWLKQFPAAMPVALEAAFGWPWIADLLEELALEPHLAHPLAVKLLAKNQAKTDRCDSDRLAGFQLRGILPESYLAPPDVRQLRERIRYRMALSAVRTGLKNRIQAILHRQGILHPWSDLFGKGGRQFLAELALPESSRYVLDSYLRLLDEVLRLLDEVEDWMTQHLADDPIVGLLQSIPGVGKILAHVLEAEIGRIERFPSHRHLASYAGLAPLSDDSADRHGRRRCALACNHCLRWACIEAANTIVRRCKSSAPRLFLLHQRLTHGGRTNKGQAKVAIARELCKLVYVVWSKRQPYTGNPPERPGQERMKTKTANNSNKPATRSVRSGQPQHPMVRRKSRTAG